MKALILLSALVLSCRLQAGFNTPMGTYLHVSKVSGTLTLAASTALVKQVPITITASSFASPYVIDSVQLDFSGITLNTSVGVQTKIDASTYRALGTDVSFLAAATNKGVYLGSYSGMVSDTQFYIISSGSGEPSPVSIPYTFVIRY